MPDVTQRLLYKKAFFQLAGQLPKTDTVQGSEAKLVILGFTTSAADNASDLGFLKDDRRCNVAQSRMIEARVDVALNGLAERSLKHERMSANILSMTLLLPKCLVLVNKTTEQTQN